jgi:endonuclease-8
MQFYAWRKEFQLRANLRMYQKGTCPRCGGKAVRKKTGKRERWSYWCPHCQV